MHISINNLTNIIIFISNSILRSSTIYLSNLLKLICMQNYFNKKNNINVCIILLLDDFYFYFHINIYV